MRMAQRIAPERRGFRTKYGRSRDDDRPGFTNRTRSSLERTLGIKLL